jgi:uncharacterized protein YceK
MRKYLPIAALMILSGAGSISTLQAGGTGYSSSVYRGSACADSKFQTPRYNQILPYRHFEDRRRYNAAPCSGETVYTEPYLLKTVVVTKKRVPHYTYDRFGNRRCTKVVTTVYKDLYSDGSCRVWSTQS